VFERQDLSFPNWTRWWRRQRHLCIYG